MRTEQDGSRWYQVKNHQFEEMWVFGDFIYRGIDTSPGNGEAYILYDDDPFGGLDEQNPPSGGDYGSRWMLRLVTIGDRFKRVAWVEFRRKDTGEPVASKPVYRDETELRIEALHENYTFPSGITLPDVLELQAVMQDGTGFEAYFYAKSYGLVMWKALWIGTTYHITQAHVDAPQLEREKLAWWEAMDKTIPPVPKPEPDTPAPAPKPDPAPDVPIPPVSLLDAETRQKIAQSLDDLEAAFSNFISVCRAAIASVSPDGQLPK